MVIKIFITDVLTEIASSRTRMRVGLRRQRARHTNCLWPTLKERNASENLIAIRVHNTDFLTEVASSRTRI